MCILTVAGACHALQLWDAVLSHPQWSTSGQSYLQAAQSARRSGRVDRCRVVLSRGLGLVTDAVSVEALCAAWEELETEAGAPLCDVDAAAVRIASRRRDIAHAAGVGVASGDGGDGGDGDRDAGGGNGERRQRRDKPDRRDDRRKSDGKGDRKGDRRDGRGDKKDRKGDKKGDRKRGRVGDGDAADGVEGGVDGDAGDARRDAGTAKAKTKRRRRDEGGDEAAAAVDDDAMAGGAGEGEGGNGGVGGDGGDGGDGADASVAASAAAPAAKPRSAAATLRNAESHLATVFVRNLSFAVTAEELRTLFGAVR